MREVCNLSVNDLGMRDLEDLYGKLCGKKSGFFHVRSSNHRYLLSSNFGSSISDGDIVIVKGCVISDFITFESLGKNIKIIFINCDIKNGLNIDLECLNNSRNKVGFFYCNFKGDISIKASKVELFSSTLDDEDSSVYIKSDVSYFKFNKLNQGDLEVVSKKVMLEDNSILLERLGISSNMHFIGNSDIRYDFCPKKLELKKNC